MTISTHENYRNFLIVVYPRTGLSMVYLGGYLKHEAMTLLDAKAWIDRSYA